MNNRRLYISIHTSAKEVTVCGDSILPVCGDFNPHFREGSDIGYKFQILERIISIHTSAKEVTAKSIKDAEGRLFQSTLPRRK